MRQTWRWFGPKDTVSVPDMLQAGVQGVVSALHHVPTGDVWTLEEIAKRQNEISTLTDGRPSGIHWEVVESLPVSEDIKKQTGAWKDHIANYKLSLQNLADAGLEVVCYNFMPILDWTRTDLAWPRPDGATCMRFDLIDFVAFDIFILKRIGAADGFTADVVDQARERFERMSDFDRDTLARNVVFGLPGSAEHFTIDGVRELLAEYNAVTAEALRQNLIDFLQEVVPVAERLGLRLCCHPDDPPFGLLGLPRIMSTEADYASVMEAVDSPANGITLCTGSLGVHPDVDLPGMMDRLGDRVHFLHLRNVKRDEDVVPNSFYEARHLEGDTDMVAVIAAVLREEARRREQGRADAVIPMRPDHGQDILDDQSKRTQPGYPAIGRLKGLAELRGIETALTHPTFGPYR